MERSLRRYLRYHRVNNRSPKTLKYHEDTIGRSLMGFLRERGHSLDVQDLTAEDVEDWIEDQQARGLSQKTIATRVISVRAFTRWLADPDGGDTLAKDPLRRLKVPKVDDLVKPALAPADVDRLLAQCDRKTLTGRRDFAILMLLFSTGLRAAELCALQVSDVDWDNRHIVVRRGKGGKFRVLPMGHAVEKALDRYLYHKDRPEHGHLFLTIHGEPLQYRGLYTVLERLAGRAGVHCNPHMWRHTAAIEYFRAGGRGETLQKLLGHATMHMTLRYARIAGVDVVAEHETADPAHRLKTR